MKLPFGVKIGLAISVLAVGATAGSIGFFYSNTKTIMLAQMGNRLKDIGRTAAHLFGPEEKKAIELLKKSVEKVALPTDLVTDDMLPGDYRRSIPDDIAASLMRGPEFQRLVSLLKSIKNATRNISKVGTSTGGESEAKPTIAYATLMTTIDSVKDHSIIRFIADADYDDPTFPNPVGNLFYNNSLAIRSSLDGEVQSDTNFRYENSEYLLSAGIPLLNDDGTLLAVLSLDYGALGEVNKVQSLWRLCVLIVLGSFVLSLAVAVLLARLLNRPIKKLREGAERVARRDFTTRIELHSNDELGLLANAFNTMVTEIKEYSLDLENHNSAYARFVPKEFLSQLGQTSILQVKLGDQIQKRMTVLFADIRSFTMVSESMSPRDNFDFINEYLGRVSPIIRAHRGFVDKFIGDAVMALFPESAEHAVSAALEMQRSLVDFNAVGKEIGRPEIKIGIGLHTGNLMLGTVGECMRMEGTVISSAVNLSSRLEGLTKEYGVDIIISDKVQKAIADKKLGCHIRSLGPARVKGKKGDVHIYEVIDSNKDDGSRRKIITLDDFEKGIEAFSKKKYQKALSYFQKVQEIDKDDLAVRFLSERCEKYIRSPKLRKNSVGQLYSLADVSKRGTDV